MRLGCPNCDAQYEVDDAAIPAAGRDVQCSNCGHTWFQLPERLRASVRPATAAKPQSAAPSAATRPSRPARPAGPEVASTPPAPAASVVAPHQPTAPAPAAQPHGADTAPVPEPRPEPATAAQAAALHTAGEPIAAAGRPQAPPDPEPETAAAAHGAPPSRRTLDDNLMSILREEAAREAAERRAEAERAMQVQPELGLQETSRRPANRAADNSFADLSAPDRHAGAEAEPEPPRTRPPSRRALLPDIEEINSTLRPGTDHRDGEDMPAIQEAAERRKGFGTGFLTVILLAVLLALAYVFAPQLAKMVPQASGALESYVAGVDAARLWLDMALKQATGALQGLTGETEAPQG